MACQHNSTLSFSHQNLVQERAADVMEIQHYVTYTTLPARCFLSAYHTHKGQEVSVLVSSRSNYQAFLYNVSILNQPT